MALSSVNLSSLSAVNLAQPDRGLEDMLKDEIEVTMFSPSFSPIECVKNDISLSTLLETGEAEERSRSPVVYDTSSDEDENNDKLGSIIDAAAAEPPAQPASAPQSASLPTAKALDANEAGDWFASPLLPILSKFTEDMPILTPDEPEKFTDDIGTNLEEAFSKMYDEAHSMVSNTYDEAHSMVPKKAEMQGQLDKFVAGTCIGAAGLTSVVGSDFAAYSKIASDSLQGLVSGDSTDITPAAASAPKEQEEVVVSIETSLDTSAAPAADEKKRNLSVQCTEEVSDVNLNVLTPAASGSCPPLRDDMVGKLNQFVDVACVSASTLINRPEVKRVLDSTNSSVYSCSQMATDSIQNLIMRKNGAVKVCSAECSADGFATLLEKTESISTVKVSSADGFATLLERTESIEVLADADVDAGEGESSANSNLEEGRALGIPSQDIVVTPADPPAVPNNDMDGSVITATFNSIVEKVTGFGEGTETSTVNEVVSACMCPVDRTDGSNISLMESLQSFTTGGFNEEPDTMAPVCLVKGFPSPLQSPTSVAHGEAVVDSRNQSDDAIDFAATKIETDTSMTFEETQDLDARITATTSTDRTSHASDSIPNPGGDDVSRMIENKSEEHRTPDDISFDENSVKDSTAASDKNAISSFTDAPEKTHIVDKNAAAAEAFEPVILTRTTGGAALPAKVDKPVILTQGTGGAAPPSGIPQFDPEILVSAMNNMNNFVRSTGIQIQSYFHHTK
eukprot:CAMPEP_0194290258 /NCGR_PEP_ID=MMETSP0169-20130528/40863_1 /TAXON_ID=218684 /ORGANISM="Corethron pennatum, Strain L29A3" /LENGTH=737 /DNA_ID=CAMNT_0039037795 /DNA_START=303 /DNA_END=2516 /DNA_ORIENTATION=-